MEIIKSLCIIAICLTAVDSFDRVIRASKCPRIENFPGKVKYRRRGTRAQFRCPRGTSRYGSRTLNCQSDSTWDGEPPICIQPGCVPIDLSSAEKLDMSEKSGGALLTFVCEDGYQLIGLTELYCNGHSWSGTIPTCTAPHELTECDFEANICGWTQDDTDERDWIRNAGPTQTGNTGPKNDHTNPDSPSGHYLYFETSNPTLNNDQARLISPTYTEELSPMCFDFWYHMLGPDDHGHVGTLEVFVVGQSAFIDELQPLFYKEGNQGDLWHRGEIIIDEMDEPYNIVIEATKKLSYISDIALDDVRLYNCSESITTTTTTIPSTSESTTQSTTTSSVTPQTRTPTPAKTTTQMTRKITTETETKLPTKTTTSTKSSVQSKPTTTSSSSSSSGATKSPTASTKAPPVTTRVSSTKQKSTVPTSKITQTVNDTSTEKATSLMTSVPTKATALPTKLTTSTPLPSTTLKTSTYASTAKPGIITVTTSTTTSPTPAETTTTTPATETTRAATTTTIKATTAKPTTQSTITTSTFKPTKSTKVSTTLSQSTTSTSSSKKTTKSTKSPDIANPSTAAVTSKPSTVSTKGSTRSVMSDTSSTSKLHQTTPVTTLSKKTTKLKNTSTSPTRTPPKLSSTAKTDKMHEQQTTQPPTKETTASQITEENSTKNASLEPHVLVSEQRTQHPHDETLKPLMIGLGVGIIVGLIIIGVVAWVCVRRRKFYTSRYEDELKPITKSTSSHSLNNVQYYHDEEYESES